MIRTLVSEIYHAYAPKMIHGDLSPDHFLIDSETKDLTGIIDFGDIAICDPDYEYLYIFEDCGKSFTCDLLHARGHEEYEPVFRKNFVLRHLRSS